VALLVTIIGVGCAWAVTALAFPGRRILSWALVVYALLAWIALRSLPSQKEEQQ
jgi:ABC-type Fe3+ transport system permease subunit